MTPIFVRPVREQLEHDRLIRFLQARYKRKFDAAINAGDEQLAPVKLGVNTFFPDVVLMSGKKLAGLVEVETSESINNLEAMAQWTHFSRARVPFHLYVPVLTVDAARRLCDANRVTVSEIWTFRSVNDQFDLVRVFSDPGAVRAGAKAAPKPAPAAKPAAAVAPPPKAVVAAAKRPAARPKRRLKPKPKPKHHARPKTKAKPKKRK